MTSNSLASLSDSLADVVAAIAPSVVQVQGGRRPASGVVYAEDVVITMVRTLNGEDGLHVRTNEGTTLDAELIGWDPTTGVAVLRTNGRAGSPIAPAPSAPRVGHLALAVGRSWSNVVSASAGIVSVIGGPLRTGRRRAIEQVLRTTAPLHDGFSGGAFADTAGGLLGIATSTTIRGTTVIIPAAIAWKTAAGVIEHGGLKRGFIGISAQAVRLPEGQRIGDRESALLVAGVTAAGPAAQAGVLIGDIITELDGHAVGSPEDLFDLLAGDRVGRTLP